MPIIEEPWEEQGPPMAMSYATTEVFKTGTWRLIKPYYEEKVSPCREACPAGIDIARFLELAAEGKYLEAWRVIREESPLPAVCGRVCYHPCESVCNRKDLDQAISINAMERFVADEAVRLGAVLTPFAKLRYDHVAVIGSGPAGLSCAYFLVRMGYHVTIYEAAGKAGGVLRFGIPEYRLPKDVLDREIQQIMACGVEIKTNRRLGVNLSWDDLSSFRAVFIATGLSRGRRLGLAGEDARGVYSGLEFLDRVNRGNLMSGSGSAVVIGGGDVAVDAARTAVRAGFSRVTMACLEDREVMPAIKDGLGEALEEGVEIINGAQATKILCRDGAVSGVEFKGVSLDGWGPDGRPIITDRPGEPFQREADLLIVAIGQAPDLTFLPQDIHATGRGIQVDGWGRTSAPRVLAGGDVAGTSYSVVAAIGAGKRAAIAIDQLLHWKGKGGSLPELAVGDKGSVSMARYLSPDGDRVLKNLKKVVRFEEINLDYFEEEDRPSITRLSERERLSCFAEVNLALAEEQARREASRCFNCGNCTGCDNCYNFCPDVAVGKGNGLFTYYIKYDYCKGCGICVQECPRNALSAIQEQR